MVSIPIEEVIREQESSQGFQSCDIVRMKVISLAAIQEEPEDGSRKDDESRVDLGESQ
jgi:hypothetical protein